MRKYFVLLTLSLSFMAMGDKHLVAAEQSLEDMPEEIHACYIPGPGTIYRIKAEGAPEECRSEHHVQFSWSQGGNSGTGLELVRGTVIFEPDTFGLLPCPPGKRATNGGFRAVLNSGDERLVPTPGPTSSGDGWLLQGDPGRSEDAWVICVNG